MRQLVRLVAACMLLGACGASLEDAADRLCTELESGGILNVQRYVTGNSRYGGVDPAALETEAARKCPEAVASVGVASSASGTQNSPAAGTPSKSANWIEGYQLGHLSCGYDPEQLYSESGTRDKRKAAAWAADTFTGDIARGYTDGCVDALRGTATKHP